MTCYFVVNNDLGVVVNAIQYDGESLYEEEGCTLIAQSDVPDGVWIGWVCTDGVWTDPDSPVFEAESGQSGPISDV